MFLDVYLKKMFVGFSGYFFAARICLCHVAFLFNRCL